MTGTAHAISLAIFAVAMAMLSSVGVRTQRRTIPRCGICHYDMRGLPPQAPCPECGHRTRAEALERLKLRFKWRVAVTSMVVIIAAASIGAANVRPLWATLYRLDGYAPEVIARVMRRSAGGGGASYVSVLVSTCVWIILPWKIKWRAPIVCTGVAVATGAAVTTAVMIANAWRQGALHPPQGVGVLSSMLGAIAGVAFAIIHDLYRNRRRRRGRAVQPARPAPKP